MKKSTILSCSAVALLLAACTNENISEKHVFVPGDSDVEIKLASSASVDVTRAPIEGDGDIDGMGVFCFARGYQEGSGSISWGTTSDGTCLMDNVLSNKKGGSILWDDAGKKYYYPADQVYNYSFYGYYPYSANVNKSGNKVTVDYTIDGETDIIWGEEIGSGKYQYSAGYYREESSPMDPTLTLHHMLTRLVFELEQGEATQGEEATDVTLDAISVTDAASGCQLNIADITDPALGDRLQSTGGTQSLALNSSNLPCKAVAASGAGQTVSLGEGIMLFPQNTFNIQLTTTTTSEGTPTQSTIEKTIELTNGSFEAGNAYKIKILINGPRRITLNASLIPWQNVTGPSIKL